MPKKYLALAIFVLTSGCALSPERASQMSMYDLCEKMLTSNNSTTRSVAFEALENKGELERCRANADNIKQARYVSDAALSRLSGTMMGLSAMENARTQSQSQVFCNTSQQGYYGHVNCWQQ